jgi:hypothetical protein
VVQCTPSCGRRSLGRPSPPRGRRRYWSSGSAARRPVAKPPSAASCSASTSWVRTNAARVSTSATPFRSNRDAEARCIVQRVGLGGSQIGPPGCDNNRQYDGPPGAVSAESVLASGPIATQLQTLHASAARDDCQRSAARTRCLRAWCSGAVCTQGRRADAIAANSCEHAFPRLLRWRLFRATFGERCTLYAGQ